jgi:UDP-galactopyranose mutase
MKKVLIVGAGFYGAITARELQDRGYDVLVIDKRNHIGGNCYTKIDNNIPIHVYGPHIFHTNEKRIWDWMNGLVEMENYIFSPIGRFYNQDYSLPFNMWTFQQLWGVKTPEEAKSMISVQSDGVQIPKNLEEQAIKLVGKDVYEKLIKGYTTKQWGRNPVDLPAFIIKRLPVRFEYNNNYFNDNYQGIPKGGYTAIFEKLLSGISIQLNVNFLEKRDFFSKEFDFIVYTGPIDEFFNYSEGELEYRSLRWEHEKHDLESYQGTAVINYTDSETRFTRVIEHKHFNKKDPNSSLTIVSKEFPQNYTRGEEPFYPVNNEENNKRYLKYEKLAMAQEGIHFGGRLAKYKYYDMHQVIASALNDVDSIIAKINENNNLHAQGF